MEGYLFVFAWFRSGDYSSTENYLVIGETNINHTILGNFFRGGSYVMIN